MDRLGDSAFVLRDLGEPAYRVAEALRGAELPGVIDAAASYDTVGVYLAAPGLVEEADLRRVLESLRLPKELEPRSHVILVCYEMGDDLAEVARTLAMADGEVVRLHQSVEYRCYAVGFCPGFAYLGWLPEELRGLARLETPRVRVTPGSVGLTGSQTAVYPLETPGGWRLIGRTPLTLVDVADGYFPIRAGDVVRFSRIDEAEFERLKGERL